MNDKERFMDTYQTVQERQREELRKARVQFMWFMAVLTLLSFIFTEPGRR